MSSNNEEEKVIQLSDYEKDKPGYEENQLERISSPLSVFPSSRFALPAFVVFLICFVATSLFNDISIRKMLWASGRTVFMEHQYWRLITTIFLHADLQHLLSNALLLLVFGWFLRAFFGLKIFPVAALATGIISTAISLAYYVPDMKLVGASGMVYGMAALWLIFYIKHETGYSPGKRVFRAAGFSLALLFPTTFQVHVSYIAHATGFLSGLLIALVLIPLVKINNNVGAKNDKDIS